MTNEPMTLMSHIVAWGAGFASGTLATALIEGPWSMASVALTGAIAAVITVAVHAGEREGRPARADLHKRVAGSFGDRAHAVSPMWGPLGVAVSAARLVAEAACLRRADRLRGVS